MKGLNPILLVSGCWYLSLSCWVALAWLLQLQLTAHLPLSLPLLLMWANQLQLFGTTTRKDFADENQHLGPKGEAAQTAAFWPDWCSFLISETSLPPTS